jgi:hypothetical protein
LHNPCEKFDVKKLLLKTFVIFPRTENERERMGVRVRGAGWVWVRARDIGWVWVRALLSNIRKLNNRIIE